MCTARSSSTRSTMQRASAYVLAKATPLIFSALALAVCFKAGLFNIGVEGQFMFAMVIAAAASLVA